MSGFFQTIFYFGYSAPSHVPALAHTLTVALTRSGCSVHVLRGTRRDVWHVGLLRLLRVRPLVTAGRTEGLSAESPCRHHGCLDARFPALCVAGRIYVNIKSD